MGNRIRFKAGTKFFARLEDSAPKYTFERTDSTVPQTKFVKLVDTAVKKEDGTTFPLYTSLTRKSTPCSVSVLPYYIDEECEPIFLFTNQFRAPLISDKKTGREISLFAGLIDEQDFDDGKKLDDAIQRTLARELKEECGGDVKIKKGLCISPLGAKSAGASDERESIFLVEIDPVVGEQNLEADEDISIIEVPYSELGLFRDECKKSAGSGLDFSIVLHTAIYAVRERDGSCEKFITESVDDLARRSSDGQPGSGTK